jgi:hypothetical protein
MKININLAEECYPCVILRVFDPKYYKDYSPNVGDRFNAEVPNDILQKWVKAFLSFEQAQEEIANYFGDSESYRPDFCEFDSLEEIV